MTHIFRGQGLRFSLLKTLQVVSNITSGHLSTMTAESIMMTVNIVAFGYRPIINF